VCGTKRTHGRVEKVQGFAVKARRKDTTRKTKASVGGWGENRSLGDGLRGVEWIPFAQDRGRWRAVVNAVMRHGVGWLVS
jgi:hypothetical protein